MASKLQKIILKHFENAAFEKGRIAFNVAQVGPALFFFQYTLIHQNKQVPCQPNGNDCGCFLIYFAKKFFSNPAETMAIIKVTSPMDSAD